MRQALKKDKRYTYSDYVSWPDDEMWEIIDGEAYCMTPVPKIRHQNIVSNLHITLKKHPGNWCQF